MQQSLPGQPEPLPEAREVVAGIWKITLPIPFPLQTVNMYALVGNHGWTLVDTGMGMPEARTALTAALQKAGLSIDTLDTIVLSHHHPDHVGYKSSGQALCLRSSGASRGFCCSMACLQASYGLHRLIQRPCVTSFACHRTML